MCLGFTLARTGKPLWCTRAMVVVSIGAHAIGGPGVFGAEDGDVHTCALTKSTHGVEVSRSCGMTGTRARFPLETACSSVHEDRRELGQHRPPWIAHISV